MSNASANRGITKNALTTSQMNGISPMNPALFGRQQKMPIPFSDYITDSNNFNAVLRNF
jgi:hypothetical protein